MNPKNFIIAFALLLALKASAQTIPNNSFENWTLVGGQYLAPDEWTTNAADFSNTVVRETPGYAGNYALQLNTNGFARVAFELENYPSALNAVVKTAYEGIDSSYILINVYYNGQVIRNGAWMNMSGNAIATWTPISIPINGGSPCADSVEIVIYGGIDPSSSFSIDELSFDYGAPLLQVNYTSQDAICSGNPTGSIDITVTGGVSPYTYVWNTGEITEDIQNLTPGNYHVIVTDMNGCTVTKPIFINELLQMQAQLTSNTGGVYPDTLCVNVSGGTAPYQYNWAGDVNVLAAPCFELLSGGFTITITDVNGCTTSATDTCIGFQINSNVQDISCYGGNDGSICVSVSNGSIDTYLWSNGMSGSAQTLPLCLNNLPSGSYSVTVTNNNGCSASSNTIIVSEPPQNVLCVWPGDADANGIVDNNDLLPIGLAYGETGSARTQQGIQWYAHPAQDWADTLPSGTNYKHIDCDGNGIINADDTLAIIQNFGLTHLKNSSQREWRMNAPALYVDLIPDTVLAGETLVANLILGDINIPANDVYGLAFTINYNANVVDSAQTSVAFGSSWLGTVSEKISIAKDFPQNGEIKCAITRIDKNTRSGLGIIGQASFIITTDNINGKNELAYTDMKVWISDLTVIDNQGQILEINEGSDSTQVGFEPVSVTEKPLSLNELIIQPNPATNEVFISVSDNLLSGTLTVIDTEGKIVFSKTITTHANKIHTANFANGVYFVKVISEKGVLMKRLAIVK